MIRRIITSLLLCVTLHTTSGNEFCPQNKWHEQRGQLYTNQFHLYFCDGLGNLISPWHDIPLYATENEDDREQLYNMVVEIPRFAHAKLEINKFLPLNPILQDRWSNGEPRFVKNLWPYHGYLWNYGAFPQTFEDPQYECPRTAAVGDFDPVDVIEIGQKVWSAGSVIRVKVLGILPLVDQDESDWKVVVINHNDPMAAELNSMADVEEFMPGFVEDTVRWFTYYKKPSGKKANVVAMNGTIEDVDLAKAIIDEVHEAWRHLMTDVGRCSEHKMICSHTKEFADPALRVLDHEYLITQEQAQELVLGEQQMSDNAQRPIDVDMFSFVPDSAVEKRAPTSGNDMCS